MADSFDVKKFSTSDIKSLLRELVDESTSPDKLKAHLKTLLIFSFESKDISAELLEGGVIEALVVLYNSSKGKVFKGKIASIFALLSSEENQNDEKCVAEVALIALSNLFAKSNANIFLQCISGIKDIAINPALLSSPSFASSSASSSLPSSSPSSSPLFLSVSSSAMLLEKAAELLSSSAVKDRTKQDVLDTLLQLVSAGVMNEAAEFVGWRQTQAPSHGKNGSGSAGGGGSGSGGGVGGEGGGGLEKSAIPAERFVMAFDAFTKSVKELSGKRTFLGCGAERIYQFIEEKSFFPTFATLNSLDKAVVNLPLKFLVNTARNTVTNSGNKLYWNSNSGWGTHFVDLEMNEGLYKIIIECNGQMNGGGEGFGVAIKSLLQTLSSTHVQGSQSSGTCFVSPGCITCGDSGVVSSSLYTGSGKVTLGLELDANKHILYFFVNDTQIPHCVVNVPPAVYFGYCGYYKGLSVELKFLAKLAKPSINPSLSCAQYSWK